MKKIFSKFWIVIFLFVAVIGCKNDEGDNQQEKPDQGWNLNIYSVNDLHGALDDGDNRNLAITGQYLINQKNLNKNTLILANGDMFQGTPVSNYYYGLPIIEWMNSVGFDSMSIGNHEFDWGIEEIAKYKDGILENGEADFNLVSANIYSKETNQPVDFFKPYDIFEKDGLRIGVIGLIGQLESSISVSKVAPYKFVNPADTAKKYAKILREEEKVDIVIVNIHDYNNSTLNNIASYSQSQKVDAIITGHTHTNVKTKINGVPVVQAESSNKAVGLITLNINKDKEVTSSYVETLSVSVSMASPNLEIKQNIIDYYNELVDPIFNEVLTTAGESVSKTNVGQWSAKIMKAYTNADIALMNTGGIRSGFPLYEGDPISFGTAIKFSPFDNFVKYADYTGDDIEKIAGFLKNRASSYFLSCDVSEIDNILKDKTKVYRIATVDFVFDAESVFYQNPNQNNTQVILYNLMKKEFELLKDLGQKWYPSQEVVINSDSLDY